MKQRRQLTQSELEGLPREVWNLELIQIESDAVELGRQSIAGLAQDMRKQEGITAEMIVELRAQLIAEPVPQPIS